MRILLVIFALFASANAAWVMFSDGEDTYIYNNVSGDIYIRHKNGGKNYEDNFIKMPSGVIPQNKSANNAKKSQDSKDTRESNNELMQKLRDIERQILDSAVGI